MVVIECVQGDVEAPGPVVAPGGDYGRDNREPAPGRAVIGGHADGAGVVPQTRVYVLRVQNTRAYILRVRNTRAKTLRKRQAGMAADDGVHVQTVDHVGLGCNRGRGEDVFGDVFRPAVDDGEAPPAQGEPHLPGKPPHPGAGVVVQHYRGEGKPVIRPRLAVAVLREAAIAVIGGKAQGFLAIAHDHGNAGGTDQADAGFRFRAVGDDVAGANGSFGRDVPGLRLRQHGLGRLGVGIGAAEAQHGAVQRAQVEAQVWNCIGGHVGVGDAVIPDYTTRRRGRRTWRNGDG